MMNALRGFQGKRYFL